MTSAPGQPGRDDAAEPDAAGLGEAIRTGRVPVVPGSLVDLVMRSGSDDASDPSPADSGPAPDSASRPGSAGDGSRTGEPRTGAGTPAGTTAPGATTGRTG